MKFTATIIAAAIASVAAFAPKGTSVRSSTGLNNFAPTKWSPKGGSGGFAPRNPAPQPASYSTPEPIAPPAAAPVASSGPKKSYSMTKWTPHGGAVPHGSAPASYAPVNGASAPASVAPEPVAAAPASSYAPPAQKNYKMTKWTPTGGAVPFGAAGSFTPVAAEPTYQSAPAAPVSSGPAAPVKKNYKMTKWTPDGGAVPFGAPGSYTPVAAAEPAYQSAPVAAAAAPVAPARKNYSMTKWTPKGGAVPFSAPGSYTPPAAVNGVAESAPVSSYTAPPAPVASSPKSYSMTKWTPHGGAKPYSAPGSYTPPVNGMAAASEPYVPEPVVAAAPASYVASSGPKKNYSMTKWSPR